MTNTNMESEFNKVVKCVEEFALKLGQLNEGSIKATDELFELLSLVLVKIIEVQEQAEG